MVDYGLKGKTVIITGVNNPKGIGATTAIAFAKEGANVAMTYKKMDFPYDVTKAIGDNIDSYHKALAGDCSDVEEIIKSITSDYIFVEGDISDETFVLFFYDQVMKKFDSADILINNAASYSLRDTIFTISADDMNDVYDTNIKGTLLMIREFVKRFVSYGRVINLSTDSAQNFAGQIVYGSSKAAIEALTSAIAVDVGHLGITVNSVAPGPIQTGWIDEELEKSCLPNIPIGRLGLPQDITNTILFLSSDKADWLTGNVIKVSGGDQL
ncbi:MAG: 3-oxoacyl-ACP reductase FabG [Candidatus Improbicoccus devescovinae]|nr:MAG: 3-oxoacyl-ACP reductase FabG [Candidatus Improbicoccus devescovinae]